MHGGAGVPKASHCWSRTVGVELWIELQVELWIELQVELWSRIEDRIAGKIVG